MISKDPKVLKAIDRLAKATKRFEKAIKFEAALVKKLEDDPFWAQTAILATLAEKGVMSRDVLDTWIDAASREGVDREKLTAFAEWQMAMVGLQTLGQPGNPPHPKFTFSPGGAPL